MNMSENEMKLLDSVVSLQTKLSNWIMVQNIPGGKDRRGSIRDTVASTMGELKRSVFFKSK